jgi:hypothetical protein
MSNILKYALGETEENAVKMLKDVVDFEIVRVTEKNFTKKPKKQNIKRLNIIIDENEKIVDIFLG